MSVEHNVDRNSFGIGSLIIAISLITLFVLGFTQIGEMVMDFIISKIPTA